MSDLISGEDVSRGVTGQSRAQRGPGLPLDPVSGQVSGQPPAQLPVEPPVGVGVGVGGDTDTDSPGEELVFHVALLALEQGEKFSLAHIAEAIEGYEESAEATVMLSSLLRSLSDSGVSFGGDKMLELLEREESFAGEVEAAKITHEAALSDDDVEDDTGIIAETADADFNAETTAETTEGAAP